MFRKIWGRRFREWTCAEDYCSDAHFYANLARKRYGFERWDLQFLGRIHSWAGHVARMAVWGPERYLVHALRYRDHRYLASLREMFGQELHGRRFQVWRWEKMFVDIYGLNWWEVAKDPEAWKDSQTEWLMSQTHDDGLIEWFE